MQNIINLVDLENLVMCKCVWMYIGSRVPPYSLPSCVLAPFLSTNSSRIRSRLLVTPTCKAFSMMQLTMRHPWWITPRSSRTPTSWTTPCPSKIPSLALPVPIPVPIKNGRPCVVVRGSLLGPVMTWPSLVSSDGCLTSTGCALPKFHVQPIACLCRLHPDHPSSQGQPIPLPSCISLPIFLHSFRSTLVPVFLLKLPPPLSLLPSVCRTRLIRYQPITKVSYLSNWTISTPYIEVWGNLLPKRHPIQIHPPIIQAHVGLLNVSWWALVPTLVTMVEQRITGVWRPCEQKKW